MKSNIKKVIAFLLFLINTFGYAQQNKLVNAQYNGLRITAAAAYDLPAIQQSNKYLDYQKAFAPSFSINHYWNKWGVGVDADLITNKTKNNYPTSNLLNFGNVPVVNFSLVEKKLKRQIYSVGPNYQIAPINKKWSAEIQGRIGISSTKGGGSSLNDNTTPRLVNFFEGFNEKHIIAAKTSIKGNYLIAKKLAVTAGVYYLYQHRAVEQINTGLGVSNYFQPFGVVGTNFKYSGLPIFSVVTSTTNIRSIGANLGLTYLFNKATPQPKKEKKVENTLTVLAKDKISGVVMPNAVVTVKNAVGEVVKTAATDENGNAIITGLKPDNYSIEVSIAGQSFEPAAITMSDMKASKQNKKDVWYNDPNFVIDGKILQCNTTNPLPGTKVVLNSDDGTINFETVTDNNGAYQLRVVKGKTYTLYGQKNNFFSQVVSLNPADFDRKKSVFIQLEICGEIVDCKNAIKLNNILFDLAKADLNTAAKKELDKLVRFMTDNSAAKVELGSHTDSRGANDANQTLSQKRADASVAYIVSKGISQDRIIAKGYGETKLLNKCADGVNCNENEHAKNRRTEIKLICE